MADDGVLGVAGDHLDDAEREPDRGPVRGAQHHPGLVRGAAPAGARPVEVPGALHLQVGVQRVARPSPPIRVSRCLPRASGAPPPRRPDRSRVACAGTRKSVAVSVDAGQRLVEVQRGAPHGVALGHLVTSLGSGRVLSPLVTSISRMTGQQHRGRAERVLDLAPDAASARAGERLAVAPAVVRHRPSRRRCCGGVPRQRGARRTGPTRDLDGSGVACTCPSRKRPCKHALGLLLLGSGDQVPRRAGGAGRRRRLGGRPAPRGSPGAGHPRRPGRGGGARGPARGAGAARPRGARRVALRPGARRAGGAAARRLRPGRPGRGPDGRRAGARAWPAMLRSLPARYVGDGLAGPHAGAPRAAAAAGRRAPPARRAAPATSRSPCGSRVGYPVAKESVLARPPVRDRWVALGLGRRAGLPADHPAGVAARRGHRPVGAAAELRRGRRRRSTRR